MKKIIILITIVTAGFTYSCKKEEPTPNKPCNCGLVQSDDVTDYSVVIENDCSGNNKKFYLQEGDWMNAHPGTNYCINNVTSW
jgi:hypothetical protein